MTRTILRTTCSAIVGLMSVAAMAGPAGTAFTYQGKLNFAGAPANGQYDFVFRLYASPSALIVIAGPIQVDNVPVQNGLFTTQIDFGQKFDGGERWLGIGVRPSGNGSFTSLSPRQELKPAPYAVTAQNVALPFFASGETDPPGIELIPGGLFKVAQFGEHNAVVGSTAGAGAAVYGYATGAGQAVRARATGQSAVGIHATSETGRAGQFQITNANNNVPCIQANHAGTGHVVFAHTTGGGRAGHFQIANSNSASAAIYCSTNGTGPALQCAGRAVVDVLQITGADVAEKFPVSADVQPGMVLEIDRDNPGKLRPASGAYNKRVAGVVSGAGGLPAGTILGNLPGHEDAPAVALSGRVWVMCDASQHAIEPGDLMTTADRDGHAMAVTDPSRAHGATIGKAMSALPKGEVGLVLVLVNLQ
ncbi:MAG: hypothetical protein LC135_16755 [Phycisphaerae bacterium]|nr:hypothetical protein [Phycisphaerae bacterium]MCZ2401491.1 hypothetical protein [Phycisphaerae bacterium]